MKTYTNPTEKVLTEILQRPMFEAERLESKVNEVLNDVRRNGDAALRKYTLQFDKAKINAIQVSEKEIKSAVAKCPATLKKAILLAKKNIAVFHKSQLQKEEKITTIKGVTCWRKSVAIEKVGLYIPGGTAPLLSTILMLAVPAQIAGCSEIVLCSPPGKDGKINNAILATAGLLGLRNIYKAGGVQAIGAMAYGTKTIPQVYKIFGPGNQFVTCAKQLVGKDSVAIDMPAGPSEVLVIADETANASFVAADLLSQAEHGTDSQVILITTDKNFAKKTEAEIQKQIVLLPREQTAKKALKNSKIIIVKSLDEAVRISNMYAPEHLILACKNYRKLAEKIINAGSVFLGNYSCESAGDYASGTNHTLPTNGYAKAYSGVSLDSFMKKITFQELTKEGITNIGPAIEILAASEKLDAHKKAVTLRLK